MIKKNYYKIFRPCAKVFIPTVSVLEIVQSREMLGVIHTTPARTNRNGKAESPQPVPLLSAEHVMCIEANRSLQPA